MTQLLHWFVTGKPIPQGSKTATVINGRAVMFEANKNLKGWRELIRSKIGSPHAPSDEPVRVELLFTFQKPKTVKRQHMSVKPDIDKLARAVLDCLSGTVIKDDSQVVILNVRKEYGDIDGVLIRVMTISNSLVTKHDTVLD
jgi:Holliday junction resolvase RusA-like endonuclease